MVTGLRTIFLDTGGVLVFPNWDRISAAMKERGVSVDPAALAGAEPHAKRALDRMPTIRATNDEKRGWLYFEIILEHAGVLTCQGVFRDQLKLREWGPQEPGRAMKKTRFTEEQMVTILRERQRGSSSVSRWHLTVMF